MHDFWTPIPEEFDDYISRPKANGYQSLHTVVIADDGRPLEVQIRTQEMHDFAEYGVAAHWGYKEEGGSNVAAQKYDEKIAWLRQLLAWKSEVARCRRRPGRDAARMGREAQVDARWTTASIVLTPQARVSNCRRARRRSTSPTTCTPTSATAAAARGSTARWCR